MIFKVVKLGVQAALGLVALTALGASTGYVTKENLRNFYTGLAPKSAQRAQVEKAEPKAPQASEKEPQTSAVVTPEKPQREANSQSDDADVKSPCVDATVPNATSSTSYEATELSEGDIVRAPSIDVLRVEKNGSLLLAGRAQPGSVVTLKRSDATVIGSGKAGPEGDFLILPDKELPPGNYELGLTSKNADGEEMNSAATSIVRVPEGDEEVLAMITSQGEASRIVSNPVKRKPEKAEPEGQSETVQPKAAAPSSKVVTEPQVNEDATDQDTERKNVAEPEPNNDAQPRVAMAPASKGQTQTPAQPELDQMKSVELPSSKTEKPETSREVVDAELAKPIITEPEKAELATKLAAVEPAVSPTITPKPAANAPVVVVEAVEVEGEKLFVAGAVEKGASVRVYIDNKSLGVTGGTIDNRFLISRKFSLSPGEHSVRADVIDRKSGAVLSRAEVPLLHEPEEQEAEKAPSSDSAAPTVERASNDTQSQATELALAEPSEEQPATLDDENVGNKASKPEPDVITPEVKPKAVLAVETDEEQAEPNSAAINESGEDTAPQPEKVVTKTESAQPTNKSSKPSGGAVAVSSQVQVAKPSSGTLTPKLAEAPESAAKKQVEQAASTVAEEQNGTPEQSAAKPKLNNTAKVAELTSETGSSKPRLAVAKSGPAASLPKSKLEDQTEPKVEPIAKAKTAATPVTPKREQSVQAIRTGSAVIIKPGDSLWRISRRSYGRGIRYTTIYEANRNQIRDPNRIYIGQIFRIPEKPKIATQ